MASPLGITTIASLADSVSPFAQRWDVDRIQSLGGEADHNTSGTSNGSNQSIERRLSDRIAGLLGLKAAIEQRAAALRGQCVKLQDDLDKMRVASPKAETAQAIERLQAAIANTTTELDVVRREQAELLQMKEEVIVALKSDVDRMSQEREVLADHLEQSQEERISAARQLAIATQEAERAQKQAALAVLRLEQLEQEHAVRERETGLLQEQFNEYRRAHRSVMEVVAGELERYQQQAQQTMVVEPTPARDELTQYCAALEREVAELRAVVQRKAAEEKEQEQLMHVQEEQLQTIRKKSEEQAYWLAEEVQQSIRERNMLLDEVHRLQHEKYEAISKTPGAVQSQELIERLARDKDLLHSRLLELTTADNTGSKHRPRIHYLQMLKAELDRHRLDKEKLQAELIKRDAELKAMQQHMEGAATATQERRRLFQTPQTARTVKVVDMDEEVTMSVRKELVQATPAVPQFSVPAAKGRKSIAQRVYEAPTASSTIKRKVKQTPMVHDKENSFVQKEKQTAKRHKRAPLAASTVV